jgi:hypothetical protein
MMSSAIQHDRVDEPREADMRNEPKYRGGNRTGGLWLLVPVLLPLLVLTAACDELLEVDVPGFVTVGALDDPELAETLVLSAQGDFECGLVDHLAFSGQWFELFLNSSASRPDALSGLRSQLVDVYADPCDSGTGPVWSTLQLPRQQAQRAVRYIEEVYPAGSVVDQDFLVAKARLYEAYSIQLLGEAFCGVTFDGGPLMTPAQTYAEAETRFAEAMTRAQASIGAGRRVSESQDILDAARVGRARSSLYLGNGGDVLAYAGAVTQGFEFLSTYETSPGRRNNRINERDNVGETMQPHIHYSQLTIEPDGSLTQGSGTGIADPRVVVDEPAGELDLRGVIQRRIQMKYPSEGSDIPFSTWREAQLMIAEVTAATDPDGAIPILNTLRTSTEGLYAEIDDSAWPLPTLDPAPGAYTAAEVDYLVKEERRRELWMQGAHHGDKLRWAGNNYPDWEPTDEYGQLQGAGTCWPVPFLEVASNPNLS